VLGLDKVYLNDKSKIIVLPKVQLREMEKLIIHYYSRLFGDRKDQIQLENPNRKDQIQFENPNNLIEGRNEVMGTMIEMIGTKEIMRIVISETDEIAGITITVISETHEIAEITTTVISGTATTIEIITMIAEIL